MSTAEEFFQSALTHHAMIEDALRRIGPFPQSLDELSNAPYIQNQMARIHAWASECHNMLANLQSCRVMIYDQVPDNVR